MPDMPDELKEMLREAISAAEDEDKPKIAPDIEAIRLREAFDSFTTTHSFKPGMIVRQKPLCKLYRGFGDNDHAIVVALLANPMFGGLSQEGSPHYNEPYDMVIGSLETARKGSSESFAIYHVDSRRFEPVPAAELQLKVGRAMQADEDFPATDVGAGVVQCP